MPLRLHALRAAFALALCGATLWVVAGHAAADELDDFERARALYVAQDYPGAARAFEHLVGTDPPRLQNPVLRLESRKYLAASYLFLGRKSAARAQFSAILDEDPTYTIDAVSFPQAVIQLFDEVREAHHAKIEEATRKKREAEASAQAAAEKARAQELARLGRLEQLASTVTVEERHSRWIAALPFGAGQFQNGDARLGRTFAITESILAATSVVTWALHTSLRNEGAEAHQPTSRIRRVAARRAERAYRITNQVSFGAFALVAAVGVLEAQLRFEPVTRRTRERPLPADLRGAANARTLAVGVGPTGASVIVRF
ncbi:MAG: hypothetical protein KC543_14445 [Myxococcales bacterium]|nr:hypothetical protein [Myxococcales bacterium]